MGFSAIHRKEVRPKAKYAVICRHQVEYPESVMCRLFDISLSGYHDFVKLLCKPEYDANLVEMIKESQGGCDR